ncbi:hypothetical protein E4T39_04261 [Aureobasidium subglaciale]|nr:hypothetical protein E4T39_04261 [Aureobasidium subglaciale]
MTPTLDDSAEARPLIVADGPSGLMVRRTTKTWASLHVIISIAAIVFMLEVSSAIALTPQIQILETIVCEKYYDRTSPSILHPSDDERCKTEAIQTEVALINGWKNTFEMVPGTKKVTLLAMLGCLLSDSWVRLICWYADKTPLRYIWLSGLWQIIGGGPPTFTSLLFVMAAQSASDKDRSDSFNVFDRIVAFSFLNVAALAAEILTVPTSAYLMSFGPWIPFMMAPALTILTTLLTVLLLPGDTENAVGSRTASSNYVISETPDTRPGEEWFSSSHTVQIPSWFTRAGIFFMIALIFFTSSLGGQSMGLLLQYSAKKFNWTFAKASWIITLRAAISFIVLTTIIPGASTMIAKYARHTTSRTKDKRLAQTSCILLLTGAMTIFFAAFPAQVILGTILAALGSSFNVTAKSFVTALVPPDNFGAVYTGITVATYGGILISGPLFAHTFHWGLQLGGSWMGLPFLVASGLFLLCLVALSLADGFWATP